MTQGEHEEGLPEPGSVVDTPAGDGKQTQLEKVGSFLLLLHKTGVGRFWEIDAVRGVAITMMVIYHLAYDLVLFGYYRVNVLIGPWRVFARVTASLFILVMGVSLALSFARDSHRARGWSDYRRYLVRGLKLLGWGMVITLATWVYMRQPVVIFGILHVIGAITILSYPFLSLGWPNLPIGAGLIVLGLYVNRLPVSHPWLLVLGLRPRTLYQVDYFPLLPWFGVALLGIFIGQKVYQNGTRRFTLPDRREQPGVRQLIWLGRRSLAIYLIHQPILVAILSITGVMLAGR